jgi:hypothetical protein
MSSARLQERGIRARSWTRASSSPASDRAEAELRRGQSWLLHPRQRGHFRRDCRSPPDPEAAEVASQMPLGEAKAGREAIDAPSLLLAKRSEAHRLRSRG